MALLFARLSHPSKAWVGVQTVDVSTVAVGGWITTFVYILGRNSIVLALIAGGNHCLCLSLSIN